MCLILLGPVAVCFSLIYKKLIAVYSEWVKPSHPPCALASSRAQTPIIPRWRSALCTHSAGSSYQSDVLLSAGSELSWWAPSSREKEVWSVNQKWQFVIGEGKRGEWSWTLHCGGTVVSHYSPRNPHLQLFANEWQLCCPQGSVWSWGQDGLNALGWRRAAFVFIVGLEEVREIVLLLFVLCVISRWHSQPVHKRNL